MKQEKVQEGQKEHHHGHAAERDPVFSGLENIHAAECFPPKLTGSRYRQRTVGVALLRQVVGHVGILDHRHAAVGHAEVADLLQRAGLGQHLVLVGGR